MSIKRSCFIIILIFIVKISMYGGPLDSGLNNYALYLDSPSIFSEIPSGVIVGNGMGFSQNYSYNNGLHDFKLDWVYSVRSHWATGLFVDYSYIGDVANIATVGTGLGYAVSANLSLGLLAAYQYDWIKGYSVNGDEDPLFNQEFDDYFAGCSLTYLPTEDVAVNAHYSYDFKWDISRKIDLSASYVIPIDIRMIAGVNVVYDFMIRRYDVSVGMTAQLEHYRVDLGLSPNALGMGFGFEYYDVMFHAGVINRLNLGQEYTFSIEY